MGPAGLAPSWQCEGVGAGRCPLAVPLHQGEQGTTVTFVSCCGLPSPAGDEGHRAEISAACRWKIPCFAHMQMRAGDPVPTPLPLHSLLHAPARLGVSMLPPLRSPSHILAPQTCPSPWRCPGHRARLCPQGSSHCPQPVCAPGVGCARALPCRPQFHWTLALEPEKPLLKPPTYSQGPTGGPGSRGVPRSRSHPHCWAQVGEKGYARVGR